MSNINIPNMKEKQDQNFKNTIKRGVLILKDFGFKNFNELKGKKILDIGSYNAEFALAAQKEGIEIICSDINEEYQKAGLKKGLKYICANAMNLPFDDNSLDLVLSHASVPIISQTKEEVIKVLQEVKRVLKKDGEFRFGPIYLIANIFSNEEVFGNKKLESFSIKQRIERVRIASLNFLKNYDPNITETVLNYDGRIPRLYYTMKK